MRKNRIRKQMLAFNPNGRSNVARRDGQSKEWETHYRGTMLMKMKKLLRKEIRRVYIMQRQ